MIVALDSETDRGIAVLLTKPWLFCEPRSWRDCVDFLCRDPEMAAYNMDYDVQAMVKYLPSPVRNRLAMLGTAVHGEYVLRYVKKKFFKVWHRTELLFVIYDMQQFYNCSLAKAAKRLGLSQGKLTIPKTWYREMRARLADPSTRDKVLSYALQDASLLQAIIARTVVSFKKAGMDFVRPYSNASFAQRVFRKALHVTHHREAERMARRSYHGGRIECLRAGYFAEAFYYDLHSAYPSAIAALVKPTGRWSDEELTIRDDSVYAFIDCSVVIPHSVRAGPIPVRKPNGAIVYPVGHFRKVITLTEFRYLELRGWIQKVHKVWQHSWMDNLEYPFEKINSLYVQRETFPEQSYAIKIVLNSIYGKTAQILKQRVRTGKVSPRAEIFDDRAWLAKEKWKDHTSFVYASEITARIRMRVYQDADPEHVIFYATDGVMMTKPGTMSTGPNLGQWSEVERVRNLIVVGSGVYTYRREEPKTAKWERIVRFRGFNGNFDLARLLRTAGRQKWVGLTVLRNTSMRQAVNRPSEMNVLEDVTRVLDVNFDHKRAWPRDWTAEELTRKRFDSRALIHYGKVKLNRYDNMDSPRT